MASIFDKLHSRCLSFALIFIILQASTMSSKSYLTTEKTVKDWKNDYNRRKTNHKTSKHYISGSVHFCLYL